jgi:hypothetical protein
MREALRDALPTLFAPCLVLLGGLISRRRHAGSHVALCQDGGAFFLLDLARTRATKHEAAHEETEAVAADGRCCMRARCVITRSTWTTYPLGSTSGVPEGRSAALICAGAPV